MTIDQIRYFIELSNTLNFSTASENLYVSQPSLSRQIQNLEDDIGVRLVNRNRRSVSLTLAGEVFKKEFSRVLKDMNSSLEKVRMAEMEGKNIRLAILQPLQRFDCISKVVESVNLWQPGIEISIHLNKLDELYENVQMRNVDLLITTKDMHPNMENVGNIEIGIMKFGVVCPKSSNLETDITITDMDGWDLVALDEQIAPGLCEKSLQWMGKQGVFPKKIIRTGDLMNTLLHTRQEKRFAVVSENVLEMYKEQIRIISIDSSEMSTPILAIWSNENEFEFEKMFNHSAYAKFE